MAKIDCSQAVNFIRESKRMCEYYRHECSSCPISKTNNGYGRLCTVVIEQHPDRAIEIVQKWSDENPVKTRLDDIKERLPNVYLDTDNGCPHIRPAILGYCSNCYGCSNKGQESQRCWNEPVDGGATGKAVE